MQSPLGVGTTVDGRRIGRWLNKFGSYWNNPTRAAVEEWLGQFAPKDKDMAARILDAVLFFDQAHIQSKFRALLGSLEGWHVNPAQRSGRWFFVPFTSSPGESGDTMTHWFRSANGMTLSKYNELFCYRSDLVSKKLGPDDTVVLIDDFAGSGDQATGAWNAYFSELLAGEPRVVLMLLCATPQAMRRIAEGTEMNLHAAHTMRDRDNLFSQACTDFSEDEKNATLRYCRYANPTEPRGRGDCGLLLVFSYKSPNNSIPILHSTSARWTPLFPRRSD